ncbi:NAD(P)-dependent oxidoreductase [Prosthecomicrobium hirschii]|uniref:SDR family oxidoreductase n=1 Tax=Prosthecodimorpha hirschii TaxID=665126 RepID=UPI00112697D4|nr:SDR family oxidoreductase [Prosthecomicrobium hirschii]TPQ43927.1 NAD(P)-dependent oxidoreductase [Prosthecomicrobium hirschii]
MSKGVLIVTGGSRGIGRATVLLAAARGYDVVFSYVSDEAAARSLVAAVAAAGGKAVAVKSDIGSEADTLALFAEADRHGTLVGLVNNAGVVDLPVRMDEVSVERLERMLRINVIGSIVAAREALKRMSTRHGGKGGAIVNLSSAAATLGSPGQYVHYAAAKGAIDVFTLGLGREVAAEGVRVNAIRPGLIDTDIHASGGIPDRVAQLRESIPMKREGTAEECANAILWLISDESSYTTASVVTVSGGR